METSTGKKVIVVYIERLILAIGAFVISALLARTLPPSTYGIYKLVPSILIIITYIVSFGLETSVARFIPEFLLHKKTIQINQLIIFAVLIRIVILLVVFMAFIAFGNKFSVIINAPSIYDYLLVIIFPYIFFSLINNILGRALLVGYSQRHTVGYVNICSKLIMVLMIVWLAIARKGLKETISILLITAFIEFLVYFPIALSKYFQNKKTHLEINNKSEPFPFRRIVKFGLFNQLFQGGQIFREYAIDNFIISYLSNTYSVALYGVAVIIPGIIRNFTPGRMLEGILLPILVKKYEKNKSYDDMIWVYILMQKITLMIIIPTAIFFFIFAKELLGLVYGDTYLKSVNAARILIGFCVIHSATYPFYTISQAVEKPHIVFFSTFGGIYNLLADFLLIPYFGIEGAAFATGSAALLIFMYFFLVYKYMFNIVFPFPWGSLIRIIFNMLPLVVIMVIIKTLGLINIMGGGLIIIGALFYLTMCSFIKIFNPWERKIFSNNFNFSLPFI